MKSITDKLIVTTDLGHLKAYRVSRESYEASLAVEPIHDETFKDYLSHATDHESAQTHRHHLKHIATLIDGLANAHSYDGIFLAAPPTLLHGLLSHLPAATKEQVRESIDADLVKTPQAELLHRFRIS